MTGRQMRRTTVTLLLVAALTLPAALAQPGGRASGAAPATAAALADIPLSALSQDEIDGIVWMREEEKLARDVYQTLAQDYDLPVFTNIASSEQAHMDAVAALLERYDIADPAAGKAPGAFADPALQELYDNLVSKGTTSLSAALQVGATIEEIDILDLQARASAAPDVAFVYGLLERGSQNHLRAFSRLVERTSGTPYVPTYLDAATYARITGDG
jgi:hypothetical protein